MPRASKPLSPPKGLYGNYFEVGHTAFEVVIDFGQSYSNKVPSCHTAAVTETVLQFLRSNYVPADFDQELEFKVFTAKDFAKPLNAGVLSASSGGDATDGIAHRWRFR